jgi:hypothetical protein
MVARLGYAYTLQRHLAEGHALLEEGINVTIRMGARSGLIYWLRLA